MSFKKNGRHAQIVKRQTNNLAQKSLIKKEIEV